ncbi:MAG: AI-2E family transporter [Steroidobacteraceae bacterium]
MTPGQSDGNAGRAPTATLTFVVTTAGVLVFLYLIRRILLPFVLAAIVAYVCTPLIDHLAARARGARWLFALLVLLVLLALAAALAYYGFPTAEHQLLALASNPREVIAGFARVLIGDRSFNVAGASINATQIAARAAGALSQWATNGAKLLRAGGIAMSAVFELVLTWIVMGYLLFDARRLSSGLLWLVSPRRRPIVLEFCHRLDPILRRYFVGIALVVVYASVAAYIGLGPFLGLHHALLLAAITGLFELLPLIGPVASAVLAGLVAVRQAASVASILAYIAYAIALRLSIDQFFGPIVLGRAAHVRPVVVLFCFLSGGILLGVAGVVMAVPVALAIKVALSVHNDRVELGGQRGASA